MNFSHGKFVLAPKVCGVLARMEINMRMSFAEEMERKIWECAQNCDAKSFLEIVCEDALMVCGGYRNSGKEYAGYIAQFDCESYEIKDFQIIIETSDVIQNCYVVDVKVSDPRNDDLAGIFFVTSSWRKVNDKWMLVYNMDTRLGE